MDKTKTDCVTEKMSKILVLVNADTAIYNIRLELVQKLLQLGHQVTFVCPRGDRTDELVALGCKHVALEIARHGKNPLQDLKLLKGYKRIIKNEKPNVVFSYTIKCNVYGGMACQKLKVPYVANVTGLGDAIENGGLLQKLTLFLYKKGLKKAKKIYFQNKANLDFFVAKKVVKDRFELLPGSGVNLKKFVLTEYPKDEQVRFAFVGRVTQDKGVNELAQAIKRINVTHENVCFDIVGGLEQAVNPFEGLERCTYHGEQKNVYPYLQNAHAIILPTYHEGMANVLLEASASGRPVLATTVPGCIETFDEGVSGFGFEPKSVDAIVQTVERFLALSYEEKRKMGENARIKIEKSFDRNIIINKYVEQI